ncbi:hypothetical protein LPN04_29445 [Rugamonas sp. A1-17]|nr:hypothetical protein [Rugamonas sp. A1-17]
MNAPLDNPVSVLAERPAISSANPDSPTTVRTQEGRVVKNAHKIERITTVVDTRITARFYSWQISREIRRDFNLLSNKLVMRVKTDSARRQVYDLLMEIRLQAQLLQTEAESFPILQLASPQEVELRIVTPLAALLYRVLNEADISVARLTEASKAGLIMQSKQESLVAPLFIAYSDVKNYLLNKEISNTKTAAQLGREIGIS